MDAIGIGWTIAGVLVAVVFGVAGLVTWLVSYQRSHPKRRIEWSHTSKPVIGGDLAESDIEFRVKGTEVRLPFFNEFTLRSNSRADIPSTLFDGGKPITLKVRGGAVVVGDFSGDIKHNGAMGGSGMSWVHFDYGPQLIRKHGSSSFFFVSEGPASVEVESPLIDVGLKRTVQTVGMEGGGLRRAAFASAATAAATTVAVVLATSLLFPNR
ncbi:hypothetical protein [Microbacterium sp. 22296]|uniref:hypothetical protein n=1 Tax=Microbacterium sp. 22296 TaxID=3453903 RepID=UPI003F86A831